MKIVIISDLHLRAKEPLDSVHREWRLEEKLGVLKLAVKETLDQGAMLIIAGDIFDSREPPEWLKLKFWEVLAPLFQSVHHSIYILLGNHDSNLEHHAFESSQFLTDSLTQNIFVISQPEIIMTKLAELFLVPYLTQDRLKQAIEEYLSTIKTDSRRRILVGHFDLDGAVMGPAQIPIKAKLHPTDLMGFDAVILGHIHKAQSGNFSNGVWIFIGSPVYQDFGELQDPEKSFVVLEVSEDDLTLTTIPTDVTPLAELEIQETDEDLDEEMLEQVNHCAIKVVFSGSESFLKSTKVVEFRQEFQAMEAGGKFLKVIFDTKCTDRQLSEATESSSTIEEEMIRLCKERDSEQYMNIGLELLQEARNEAAAS